MNSASAIVAIITGLFGLIALVAAAIAVVRSSLIQTRLKIADGMIVGLRGDRDDLTARLTRVEAESSQTVTQLKETKALLKAETDKVSYLEGIVAGRED